MVAFDPAGDSATGAQLSGARTHCVIELYRRKYFPALLSREGQPPPGGPNILMRIALTDTEADVFHARSQRFTERRAVAAAGGLADLVERACRWRAGSRRQVGVQGSSPVVSGIGP
jgi:hypothetical protein